MLICGILSMSFSQLRNSYVYDEHLQAHPDADVWQAAVQEQRFLITQDLDDPLRFCSGRAGASAVKPAGMQAGNLIIVERMWLNTQRLTAAWLPEPVLAASWWPLRLKEGTDDPAGKSLVLWMNSTLGVTLLIANRVETRGAWTKFKKPTLLATPVLDVRALGSQALQHLAQAFDRLCEQPLLPLPQMAQDATRIAIDDALCKALRLPDLSPLRTALAREPVVCLQPLRQRRR